MSATSPFLNRRIVLDIIISAGRAPFDKMSLKSVVMSPAMTALDHLIASGGMLSIPGDVPVEV